ncbi:thiosulfate oxidation carrier protein SoxY [Pseudothioclava nitratireducens]|jgi:sulfur-oxidizing protein SoxY|uniref:thiosulfate oxidation carrier protein SoxY n=1 Tax=Pseudothioclava nitratireducens TaxID=1928646 RepID=UPI0023DB6015|nr:thiosulfate oxidation carrier protein SoxY [Defluviimonas nitratireducens]MDF1619401.1 thiosulfate oxidation carrier protein SoxY [Defluviimonas nitratireducens]
MTLTRRDALALAMGGVAASLLPARAMADAGADAIAAFTGGAEVGTDGITLTAPEIAENGNGVPIGVDAPGAVAIALYATGNPTPGVVTYTFGPKAAAQRAETRIRLSKTQDVVAVAKMADGSFKQASATVKVTIGGCGG